MASVSVDTTGNATHTLIPSTILQAAKMAQQLQEVLAKQHVSHQNLRGSEIGMKSALDNAQIELAATKVCVCVCVCVCVDICIGAYT